MTPTFSLVRGGPAYELQRRLGLVTATDLGVAWRAAALALFAWAPMTVLALLDHRVFPGEVPEPLVQHFGVHVRCLVAIPLLVLGDAIAERTIPAVVAHLTRSGLVGVSSAGALREALGAAARVRDSAIGAVVLLALAGLIAVSGLRAAPMAEELSWALGPDGTLLAAGWWYALVARPLFALLVGLWLWRLLVLWVLFRRLSRLDLELVPTHADGAGGLGFLEAVPRVFTPVVLALSSVLAGWLGHEVLYHGLELRHLLWLLGVWVALATTAFVAPLLVFVAPLTRLRTAALRDYGALVARHGRLVQRRWIGGEAVHDDDGLLAAPEIGSVADALSLHEAVEALRPVPFGLRTILPLALAALVPMLPVVALQVPLLEVVLKLAGALL